MHSPQMSDKLQKGKGIHSVQECMPYIFSKYVRSYLLPGDDSLQQKDPG